MIRNFFPWVKVTETVHRTLAHSYELIAANDGRGLLEFSEENLESNNKFLCKFRTYLSRQSGQLVSLTDTGNRLWLKSDPKMRSLNLILRWALCNKTGHSSRFLQCPEKARTMPQRYRDDHS